ncbi:TSC22 domain family protein 1 isoform X1 [Periophthalmus magnuspinnatus]|uniref:TSC22 domain family protein 1 isoform X1 n=1 Tax=Periophthalmus magnuspinnatus TaxID=409849 RepID=UPI00145B6D23|nr:TSC22 domain family protein 1 isoform X1 [Periophthalmus magnuspinnatus]
MHHPEPAADSGSGRKMAHQAVFHRRGSNTGSGSGTVLSPPTNAVVNNSHVAADEFQPALLIQCQPPAGSSSPGPHHPPPHSLNLLTQAQPAQATGALTKKKSGFQITSVTPAQVSVSTNNSIAEDTESYDDLDESHTEDLSSSEILDTSLSRANDVVGAERSSSEETLNNFHEAETPGAVSPNQPAHSLLQASTHSGAMVNGTIHHHHHHHHHQHHPNQAQAYAGNPQSAGALPNVTLKMPSNVGATQESVSQAAPPGVGVAAPGSVAGMQSSAVGTTVSIANPQSSSVSNVNMLSSANVPVRGGISTSASSSTSGFPLNVISSSGGSGANLTTSTHATIIQQQTNQNSNITMTPSSSAAATSASGGMGVRAAAVAPISAPHTAAPQQSAPAHPAPAAGTTSSRFRVVKLDSSSEPFRKGRWTCTEFYDKEAPASAPSSSASDSSSVGVRQYVSESFAGPSDRETTSGSSVSSSVSTLSHYADSVCSGESTQHPQDYASPPTGFQPVAPGAMNHMFAQDPLSQVKTSVAQPNVHLPASLTALQSQQLTYAQAVASQPTGPGPVPVQPQKVNYPVPQQAAPVQGRPEYTQPLSNVVGSANSQMIGAPQPTPLQAPPVPSHVGQSHLDGPQQKPQSLSTQIQTQSMAPLSTTSGPPHNHKNDPQTAALPGSAGGRLAQDPSIAQAHAAQASALYASLPSFTTTQLQDAQRLLLQHQSALLGLPKVPGAETGASAAGQEAEGNAAASALTSATKTVDGEDEGSSGASVVAIDNKIEQAMDLVKSHLMYAVREEVEVLKEQIKELIERNSQLEQENTLLKTLASPEQMAQFQAQVQTGSPPPAPTSTVPGPPILTQPASHSSGPSA